jgi:CDP-glucose 4,6-dehydratase
VGGREGALEDLVMAVPSEGELREAYAGRRVFLTGHTGFKGGWLALWLKELGAEIHGYALAPESTPSLFEATAVASACARSTLADIRDLPRLEGALREARPDVVFHLAAQALVRVSYDSPLPTLETNLLGTAHVLEAVRRVGRPCAVVVVTSDKCYENREWVYGYREDEAMGGHDVYSMSKGAAELVTASWRRSFFPPAKLAEHGVAIATARAGNVVGGGDWSRDRILPDCIAALAGGRPIAVRNPRGVRPWQHVLEPLSGYLLLGARLSRGPVEERARHCEPWNFGPHLDDARAVRDVVEAVIREWGSGAWEDRHDPSALHEAGLLRLSIEKAQARLGWLPRWRFDETFGKAVGWYKAFHAGTEGAALRALTVRQIHEYLES